MCLLIFFDGASIPRFARSFALLFTNSSMDESQYVTVDSSSILLLEATFVGFWNHVSIGDMVFLEGSFTIWLVFNIKGEAVM
jgi:hypothetical protein